MPASAPLAAMPCTVTALLVPTFLSEKRAEVSVKVTLSPLTRPLLERVTLALVVPS